ncbi:MAG: UDP-3-O-(3-hydroxymyristoyl)glucosamine N-acyltransferase, partial [Ponticaulis sp.]|nr:UDP-3-O-(3-hydroxymyristoyl)glucosamine N-acyltransferase [Ponticaulis sp.]
MHDLRFYKLVREVTVSDLAELTGGQIEGDPDRRIVTVSAASSAEKGAVCFVEKSRSGEQGISDTVSACFVTSEMAGQISDKVSRIIVGQPKSAFAKASEHFLKRRQLGEAQPDLGPARISESATVLANAVISDGVEIGDNSWIGPNVVIGPGVRIGSNCHIGAGVVLEAALIGNNVTIKANTVIGGDGFGLFPTSAGLEAVPHFGRVIIQDSAGIGSCVTVDRGAFGDTIIGEFTKIDNLTHIG